MKKWLSSLLILSILISLSACSFIEKDISQLITKTDNNLTETESSKSRTVQTKASETQEEIDVEQTGSQMTKSDDPKSEDEDFLNLGNYVKTRPLPSDLANLASSRDYSPSSANENIDIMIDLPEILLDSPDAKQVNDEITALENTMVEIFEREMDEYGESEGFYYYQYVDYSAYARNGVLSICIEVTDNLFSEICGHYIYNFSLANGALLNDQELIELLTDQKLNMDLLWEENIAREAKKIHDQFEHEMKSNYLEEQYSEPFYAGISDHFVGRTLLNIRTQNYVSLDIAEKNPQASKLFIDESGSLKMIYGLMSAAGSGYNLVDADFYPYAFPSERELNPMYSLICRNLAKNPWENDSKALIAYLGPCSDEESLEEALTKMTAFALTNNAYQDPALLLSHLQSEETDWQKIGTFSELYLVIPKYKNDVLEMLDLELTDAGEVREKDLVLGVTDQQVGMNFNLVGISSETMPSAGFKISNTLTEGDLWYPSLSGMDGSLIIPDDIDDFTAELDQMTEVFSADELWFDEEIFNYIQSYFLKG